MKHRLGRQRQRVIKRLRRAKEVREAEDRKIAMRLEQANQVRMYVHQHGHLQGVSYSHHCRAQSRDPLREDPLQEAHIRK